MVKKIATLATLLLLSVSVFAATPTGSVDLSYAVGACPQSSGTHFSTQSLDSSGNYSLDPHAYFFTLAAGTYCVIAAYSGDANTNPSTGYQTFTVISPKANSTTTVTVTPNQFLVGANGVTLAGSVTTP